MDSNPTARSPIEGGGAQQLARRSISIFSRRGTSTTSKPRISSLYLSMDGTPKWLTDSPDPITSSRRSMWSRKAKQPEKVRGGGTILHAVQTGLNSMSPLEIAMATSPNDEILAAAGRSTECNLSEPQSPFSTKHGKCPEPMHSSQRQSSFNTRIGVWRDGVTTWEVFPEKRSNKTLPLEDIKATQTYIYSERHTRPHLSVVIPDSSIMTDQKLRQILGEEFSFVQKPAYLQDDPVISRPSVSRKPTDPGESSIHPAFRNIGPFATPQPLPARNNDISRSSLSSNTLSHDDTTDATSTYSHPSSITSFDAGSSEDGKRDSYSSCLNVLKRSGSFTFTIPSPVKAGIFEDELANGTHLNDALTIDNNALKPSPLNISSPPSPTLSEAVHELQTQLSVIVEEPLSRAPTIPKKSRKRQWSQDRHVAQAARPPNVPLRRESAPLRSQKTGGSYQDGFRRTSSVYSSATKPLTVPTGATSSSGSQETSKVPRTPCTILEEENMCFTIMSSCSTFEDLESLSTVNKATRKTYKNNQLKLVKNVMYNISPPAWELREWSPAPFGDLASPDGLAHLELTPSAYMSCVRHDRSVVEELKDLILERCQSFIRPETVSSLKAKGTSSTSRFDDAFYRIWCFCKIFGCERGREHELKGQIDWLNGGVLAHERGCAATLNFQPELDLQGILLNAPEYFALGNQEGLSAEQLYDMSEIWDCFMMLLQGYDSGIVKAQSCGIFESAQTVPMSIAEQQSMLREWVSYILTLGPSVVLELARFAPDCIEAGFDFANFNGWTEWIQPHPSLSRGAFFRGPVSHLYEEKLVASTADQQSTKLGQRMLRKLQTEEIDLAHRQIPPHSFKKDDSRCGLQRSDSALAPEALPDVRRQYISRPTSADSQRVHSPTWSARRVSPVIEERVETFNRMSMLGFDGIAEDTSDIAINKIVELGFTAEKAKEALRVTDMGNGLRLDRAVGWLFRDAY